MGRNSPASARHPPPDYWARPSPTRLGPYLLLRPLPRPWRSRMMDFCPTCSPLMIIAAIGDVGRTDAADATLDLVHRWDAHARRRRQAGIINCGSQLKRPWCWAAPRKLRPFSPDQARRNFGAQTDCSANRASARDQRTGSHIRRARRCCDTGLRGLGYQSNQTGLRQYPAGDVYRWLGDGGADSQVNGIVPSRPATESPPLPALLSRRAEVQLSARTPTTVRTTWRDPPAAWEGTPK